MEQNTPNHRFYCLTDKQLTDYKRGDVGAAEKVWAQKHLSRCSYCAEALEKLKVVKENRYGGLNKTVVKRPAAEQTQAKWHIGTFARLDHRIKIAAGSMALVLGGIFFYNSFFSAIGKKEPGLKAAEVAVPISDRNPNDIVFQLINKPQDQQPADSLLLPNITQSAPTDGTQTPTVVAEVKKEPESAPAEPVSSSYSISQNYNEEEKASEKTPKVVVAEKSEKKDEAVERNEKETDKEEAETAVNAAPELTGSADSLSDRKALKNARKEAKEALNNGDVATAEENYWKIAQEHKKSNNQGEAKKYFEKVAELDGEYKDKAVEEMEDIE